MGVTKLTRTIAISDLKRGMLTATVARKHGVHISTAVNWKRNLDDAPVPEKVFKPYYNCKMPWRVCKAIDAVARVYFDILPDVESIVPAVRGRDYSSGKELSINHPGAILYVALIECGKSLPQIGIWFKRHHTTILLGSRRGRALIESGDPMAVQAYNDAKHALGI